MKRNSLKESISTEGDLLLKLSPVAESDILDFMKNLRGGSYFNMGMYSSIPVSRTHKDSIRIYKVIDMTAVVSGIDYENIGTTKNFRARTGIDAGSGFYTHKPGFEHKVGVSKRDATKQYLLWNIKSTSGSIVRYYFVDVVNNKVVPITKKDLLESTYLTDTEKAKLQPKAPTGINLDTGELIKNETVWRTAKFENIFWLNQFGRGTKEVGTRFAESLNEDIDEITFIDGNAGVDSDLDSLIQASMSEGRSFIEDDFYTNF